MTRAGGSHPYAPGQYNARHWRKRIHTVGNSNAVYLPFQLCRELGLSNGSEVLVYLLGRAIVLQKADEPEFTRLVARADLETVGSQ